MLYKIGDKFKNIKNSHIYRIADIYGNNILLSTWTFIMWVNVPSSELKDACKWIPKKRWFKWF